nr:MAG TPA: hypothetical protein [Caudoviricetes sp.]
MKFSTLNCVDFRKIYSKEKTILNLNRKSKNP